MKKKEFSVPLLNTTLGGSSPLVPLDLSIDPLDQTIQQAIDRVNAISDHADAALKNLSQSNLEQEIAQADLIHRQMMEEQSRLVTLFSKINP